MSQVAPTPSTSTSISNFQLVFNAALERYENKTKNKLLTHPLAVQLQSCDSPTAITSILQGLVQQFDQNRSTDQRLTSWLNPTVNVLYAFSATLGEGVGLVSSAAKVIFAGIGVLLLTARDVETSQDVLVDLFERIENFFRRLESYTAVAPTAAMTDIIVKIMVEVLSILAIMTKDIKEKRAKKYLKRLLGKNNIEDSLKRLDSLTHDEARMATAEALKTTRSVDNKIKVVLDDGKEAKEGLDQVKREQLRQDIQKWLSSPDPSTNHNTARNVQHEVKPTWFFDGGIYQEWKSSPSLLWIHGKPGSGKSILCSAIIQDIIALHDAGSALIAYFYCDFRDEDKQSRRNILLSILSQLSSQSNLNLSFDALSSLYSKYDKGTRQPSDASLIQCLKEVLSLPNRHPIYLVVDALDECPHSSGLQSPREQVLDLVNDLVDLHSSNLHICLTSRPEIDIKTVLESLTSLRVSLHDQTGQRKDIIDYVTSVVSSDKNMGRWREDDRQLVIDTLSERADGMFRWVYCQLEALRYCLPPSVRSILDDLPETLDETYERVLRSINKANREHAHRLLQCLTVAVRPLRVEELAEVLAVDFLAAQRGGIPRSNPDWRWTNQHHAVLSTCSSLIAIVNDNGSQVVQFSHFSVKEFLTSDRLAGSSMDVSRYHILLSPANTILAQACLGVLLRLDEHVTHHNAWKIPLAGYAAQHWVDHAQFEDVSSRIQKVMEYFFDMDKSHWAAWLRIYDIDKSWGIFTPWFSANAGPIYYAALCGFYDLAEHLVKNPESVNTRGGNLVSPLGAALHGNHFEVAELLHRHGADVNVRGHRDAALLHASARDGRIDMVRWLLDHCADVNAQEIDDDVPLLYAAGSGQFEICRMLLEHGADVNARGILGQVPFHRAAGPHRNRRDLVKIMQLLLDHGADVNVRDNDGCTPLHHSSYWEKGNYVAGMGTVEGSRLLLEHGAIIDAKNNEGETALQVASQAGRHEMVEFLSAWGTK
ncbi:hypothetical protein BC826DRAFT_1183634 [Russula brevipes]|nr:hypothetical protein BC826DRAFT_1183634 [Russula brevipes]